MSTSARDKIIGPHPDPFPPVTYHAYDANSPGVARKVADHIKIRLPDPDIVVEHIGSTSVPGCGGKGVIDMMVNFPPGKLEAVKEGLADLGFQKDPRPGIFSEERPMRIGTVDYRGRTYRLHVHVIVNTSPEVDALLGFRDHLRSDLELMGAYTRRKQELIESGYLVPHDYSQAKTEFVQAALSKSEKAS